MNSKFKILGVLTVFLIVALAATVSALPSIEEVKVNGNEYKANTVIERADTLELKLEVFAQNNETDIQISAEILGYEYSDFEDLEDTTHNFDMTAGDTEFKTLKLKIPEEMDKDYFDVRVRVGTKTGSSNEYLYRIHVKGDRHLLKIKKVYLSPENEVKAGGTLIAKVKVKNIGEQDEDDVSVRVAIPELGLSEVEPMGEIEEGETETSEELYLRIPRDAEAGEYTAVVTVEYDEYEKVTQEYPVEVLASETLKQEPKADEKPAVIQVSVEKQDVTKGQAGAIYPVTISNPGSEAKTFTLTADAEWADIRVSPSNVVVVNSEDSEVVYVYVSAKDTAAAGEQVFGLEVKSGEEAKSVTLKANVLEAPKSGSNTKRVLEIGLIVLVIILVIVGLVVAFSRGRKDEDLEEPEVADQTYY
ncbi:putative S-layer protein [Candidatus Woesearchaeota archaeon]|nr:putative S-layer protein [Candidatus Woesearchaeota archaeon]MBW3022414.1 putative S-layer protein [Candidatus Woesearchaeota archaeon]